MKSLCWVRGACGPVSGRDDLIGIVERGISGKEAGWRSLPGEDRDRGPALGAWLSPVGADGAVAAQSSGRKWVGSAHRVWVSSRYRARVCPGLAQRHAFDATALMRPRAALMMREMFRVPAVRMSLALKSLAYRVEEPGEVHSRQMFGLGMSFSIRPRSVWQGRAATVGQWFGHKWVFRWLATERRPSVSQLTDGPSVSGVLGAYDALGVQGRDAPGPLVGRHRSSRSVFVEAPQYNHFHITQQAGQDVNVLVEEIIRRLLDRQAEQRRSWMFDGAGA